jgi:hypothetical protein
VRAWVVLAALSLVACRRSKLPVAKHVWLTPTGGCVETLPHPTIGTRACWGSEGQGSAWAVPVAPSSAPPPPPPESPASINGLRDVIAASAGDRHSCALLANRTVACWGANEHHQLANGTTEPSERPGVIVGLVGVRQLAVAGDGACAVIDEGVVRCWGRNDRSQLGDGTTQEHTVPMPIRYGPPR